MLIAILNCCTKEELDEVDEEELHGHEATITPVDEEEVELDEHGQKVIKDKIMLVGKMSRVFALLRYVLWCALTTLSYAQHVRFLPTEKKQNALENCKHRATTLLYPTMCWHQVVRASKKLFMGFPTRK